jgi:hypothetical protein
LTLPTLTPAKIIRVSAIGIWLLSACTAASVTHAEIAAAPAISIEDVARFYRVYDGAAGHPSAEQLQHDYLDAGTEGLHRFAQLRNISGEAIAAALNAHPDLYIDARGCMAVLPRVRQRVARALKKLVELYPQTKLTPVTIAVGRSRPVGVTTSGGGVMIGLEALCAAGSLNPDPEERFVHVIAHEYAHVQQLPAMVDDEHPSVLEGSLVEGGAEFIAELISGDVAYTQFRRSTRGRELQIETDFVADKDQSDLSKWLYNTPQDQTTPDTLSDLGYWVGYRIVKRYYQRSGDKRRAVRQILNLSDPKLFLAQSGWRPGLQLH